MNSILQGNTECTVTSFMFFSLICQFLRCLLVPLLFLAVSLLFTEDEYFVTEQMLMATVCLVLSGADAPTQAAIWANVSTSDLTATGRDCILH